MTDNTFTFDGVLCTTVGVHRLDPVRRTVLPELRDEFVNVSGRAGAYVFDQPLGDVMIIIPVGAATDTTTNLDTLRQAVAVWLLKTRRRPLILSERTDRFYMAKVSSSADVQNLLDMGQADIEFRCEPYAYSSSITAASATLTASATLALPNAGDAETEPIIEVTASGSPLVGFSLKVGDRTLTYAGTLGTGATITLSSLAYAAVLGANGDTDLDGYWDAADPVLVPASGDFPILAVGANTLTWLGATSAVVVARWRHRYL